MTEPANGFDRSAAITRSLLGWGVVAGLFYLAVGIVGGLTPTWTDVWERSDRE